MDNDVVRGGLLIYDIFNHTNYDSDQGDDDDNVVVTGWRYGYLGNDVAPPGDGINATTTIETTGDAKPHTLLEIVVISIVVAIVATLTIGGNLLVIVSFRTDRQLQTISNYFLLSLSVADLAIGLVSMPLYTVYLLLDRWPLGPVVCDAWLSIDYTMSNASVANLLVISFDRYFSVTRPLTYRARRTPRRAAAMIAGAWVVSVLLWTPWIVAWPFIEGRREVPSHLCYIQFLATNQYITLATAFAAFYFPVFVMCVVYYRIYRETRRRQRGLSTLQAAAAAAASTQRRSVSDDDPEVPDVDGSSRRSSRLTGVAFRSIVRSAFRATLVNAELILARSIPPAVRPADDMEGALSCAEKRAKLNAAAEPVGSGGGSSMDGEEGAAAGGVLHKDVGERTAILQKSKRNQSHHRTARLLFGKICERRNRDEIPQQFADGIYHHHHSQQQQQQQGILPSVIQLRDCAPKSSQMATGYEGISVDDSTVSSRQSKFPPSVRRGPRDTVVRLTRTDAAGRSVTSTSVSADSSAARQDFEAAATDGGVDGGCTDDSPVWLRNTEHSPEKNRRRIQRNNDDDDEEPNSKNVNSRPASTRRTRWNQDVDVTTNDEAMLTRRPGSGRQRKVISPENPTAGTAAAGIPRQSSDDRVGRNGLQANGGNGTPLGGPAWTSTGTTRDPPRSTTSTTRRHCRNDKKQERKAAKTLSAILLAFIVTWTPYNVFTVIQTFCPTCIDRTMYAFGYWLCYINSAINPVCYALCNANFRRTYWRILTCRWFDISSRSSRSSAMSSYNNNNSGGGRSERRAAGPSTTALSTPALAGHAAGSRCSRTAGAASSAAAAAAAAPDRVVTRSASSHAAELNG